MSRTITADALEPGMHIVRNISGTDVPVRVVSTVHVMGELSVRYERPEGTTWSCTYLLGAPVRLIYTDPTDEMPDVVAAREVVKAAKQPAYDAPHSDAVWATLERAEIALHAALAKYRPKTACGCEHVRHFTPDNSPTEFAEWVRDGHPYMAVAAGSQRAYHVGEICNVCATTCMADYLIEE